MTWCRAGALALAIALGSIATAAAEVPQPPGSPSAPIPVGPRRTVAVGVIQAAGGFEASERMDAGTALTAMLTKVLAERGRVVVVERGAMDQLLNEATLRATHVSGGGATPPVKMIAAQYLVVGSVTSFGAPNKGGGFSIGGVGGGGFGGAIGIKTDTGKVSIDLRILNTRTGEVVKAFTVRHQVSHTGVSLNTEYRGVSAGVDRFTKTLVGEACRLALDEAADRIAEFAAQASWEGLVVEGDADDTIINAGASSGVSIGDRLRVDRIAHTLTDPDTGEVLSERRETLGELVIANVEPKVAHGQFTPAQPGILPQRGDLVIFVGR